MLSTGKCTNPADCNTKTDDRKLCTSCKRWFIKLKDSHEKGKNPSWHKNCRSARWSEDHWEVAKYFMPALGSNLSSVKDAESTDLSSLLSVIEWMKDAAFLGKTRVSVDLVKKLRSQVRNTWAHAPQHELTEQEKTKGFSIATEFLKDLENVCPNTKTAKCSEHLKYLKTNGVTNIPECELQSLLLQYHLLDDIREEITNMNIELSYDKNAIEEHKKNLEKLERALSECSQKMYDFDKFKENIDKQFNKFAEELKSFLGIPGDIHEIRDSIEKIRDDLAKISERQKEQPEPRSRLPDKLMIFTGREAEIRKIIALLKDKEKAVFLLHGGPGFGKTAIAIEVCHKLSEDHNIPVVFSQLTTATNEDEMIRQLCLDVGVNHEDDPKQSLMLWLKNIKRSVIFVMDDIDNLLRQKTSFYTFVRWLRKNSNQHCQILTTSRASFEIPDLSTHKVQVDEMDDEACMKLLKKKCPQQNNTFLRRLAELCGNIPLALCIAASRVNDFENSDKLLQNLENQPMKTFKHSESDQYVKQAINMSYEKCSNKEQETLVRLSVFGGSFSNNAAEAVIEENNLDTTNVLKELVSQNLIKQPTKHRYSIHLLIKYFLKDKQKSGEQKSERALAVRAELLMVKYYLNLAQQLTMKSYSKDGYKDNREALKQEASNIQNVLKICCQQEDPTSSDISDCLVRSKIYTTSAKFFSLFVRTIIPGSIVDEFLQQCANIASTRKQHAIKTNFDCVLAYQARNKTIGTDDEDFNTKMEEIKKEFETHYEDLKKDKSLCAHYYSHYGEYLLRQAQNKLGKEKLQLQIKARDQLQRSLELRETLTGTSVGKADKIFSLLHLGNVCKLISPTECSLNRENEVAIEVPLKQAQKYYEEAVHLSQNDLGEHELTSSCYKNLGDLLLDNPKIAEEKYTTAKSMRENLGLDASARHVLLLNNLGKCLRETDRANEAIEVLEKARDTAEKLAESDEPTVCKTKVHTSLAIAYDLVQKKSDAVHYAKKAMEFDRMEKIIRKYEYAKLEKILQY